jgi:hypothetical protein
MAHPEPSRRLSSVRKVLVTGLAWGCSSRKEEEGSSPLSLGHSEPCTLLPAVECCWVTHFHLLMGYSGSTGRGTTRWGGKGQ